MVRETEQSTTHDSDFKFLCFYHGRFNAEKDIQQVYLFLSHRIRACVIIQFVISND